MKHDTVPKCQYYSEYHVHERKRMIQKLSQIRGLELKKTI
jgi:hypothetical protein